MSKVIYAIIVVSLVCWAVGFFFLNIGAIIHSLLLLAVLAAIIKVLQE